MKIFNKLKELSFKEVHGDYSEYLLSRLNKSEDILSSGATAELKKGGFASSKKLLKDTEQIKVVAMAFHIPGKGGKIRHYDIEILRFKRQKPSVIDGWVRQTDFSLRNEEVKGLYDFLEEQNELLGLKFDKKIATVVYSEEEINVEELIKKTSELIKMKGGADALEKVVDEIVKSGNPEDVLTLGFTKDVIGEKRKELDVFEELIEKEDVKEVSDIQEALKKMPWIFGPEYISYDYKKAGEEIPDARLKRVDGLSDILEVKLPNEEVLREDSKKRIFLSPKCAESLGQLISYLEFYYSSYSTEHDDSTEEEKVEDLHQKYYRPKGILLIGRRSKKDVEGTKQTANSHPKFMRRILAYHNGVEILTYDDLLERARNALNNIEKSK